MRRGAPSSPLNKKPSSLSSRVWSSSSDFRTLTSLQSDSENDLEKGKAGSDQKGGPSPTQTILGGQVYGPKTDCEEGPARQQAIPKVICFHGETPGIFESPKKHESHGKALGTGKDVIFRHT